MKEQVHIGLMLQIAGEYDRGVLRGIANYSQNQPTWRIRMESSDVDGFTKLASWKPKGWIVQFGGGTMRRRLMSLRQPMVNVGFDSAIVGSVGVGNDDEAIGQLAAEHLLERRAKTFGYVSWINSPLTAGRGGSFAAAVGKAGFSCRPFPHSKQFTAKKERGEMARWLVDLPKPAALFALSDSQGRLIMDLCRELQLRVPEDVSVLGVDNEEPLSRLFWPGLSSIVVPSEQIGFQAASRLDQLLHGKRPPEKNLLLPPLGIVVRGSTRQTLVDDPKIARVLTIIAESMERRVSINELAKLVSLSRRSLERCFYRTMGRTLLEEIDRARLTRARQLLVDTSLPLKAIAAQSGFRLSQRLIESFRRNLKSTPGDYRRKMRQVN